MASTLRSAASVRTGVSGGGRSGGQTSGAARKTAAAAAAAAVVRPLRTLPKVIENNQDVTQKRLIDPEQFFNKVKDSVLTQDASSTVRISITFHRFIFILNSQVKPLIPLHNHKFFLLQSE
jgi:hypothetical protein